MSCLAVRARTCWWGDLSDSIDGGPDFDHCDGGSGGSDEFVDCEEAFQAP
jgi:hypothetical protein